MFNKFRKTIKEIPNRDETVKSLRKEGIGGFVGGCIMTYIQFNTDGLFLSIPTVIQELAIASCFSYAILMMAASFGISWKAGWGEILAQLANGLGCVSAVMFLSL